MHGCYKTIESFDEGLAERQASILTAVRPIVAALEAFDLKPEEDEEDSVPKPDDMKEMLEDALALHGNALFRCFSKYSTDVGSAHSNLIYHLTSVFSLIVSTKLSTVSMIIPDQQQVSCSPGH